MIEYHKISTVYERATDGSKKLIDGLYRDATTEYLSRLEWIWTEKIDGTNIRVHWDGHKVEFAGRTDRAQIQAELVNKLGRYFGTAEAEELFEQVFGEKDVIIFGEGYGRKIQAVGSRYKPDGVDFIVFDVMINGNFMPRAAVVEIASAFGVDAVPIIQIGTVDDAIDFVKLKPMSRFGDAPMEGLVGRPLHELKDRCGNRIILKIKVRDFE